MIRVTELEHIHRERLEETIDAAITECTDGWLRVFVKVSTYQIPMAKQLAKRYRRSGWSVRFTAWDNGTATMTLQPMDRVRALKKGRSKR